MDTRRGQVIGPKLWVAANAALLTYLSYITVKAFLSPDHITYFFYVFSKPFYAVTLTGGVFVIAELLVMIRLRGFREAPFVVGFSLALFDSSNGLINWNDPSIHWDVLFVTAIALVYLVLYLAPLAVGGFRFNLGTKALLYYLIISLIWNAVIFPPILVDYPARQFTVYLIGEPVMLALALIASSKILVSNPSSVRL